MDNVKTRTNVYRFIVPIGNFVTGDYVLNDSCHNSLVVISNGVRPTRFENLREMLLPGMTHRNPYTVLAELQDADIVAPCKKEELKKLLPHITKVMWRNWAVHVFKDDKTVVDFYNAKFKLS